MCGIYGFRVRAGNVLTPYEASALTLTMAREMEWRGRDSWGGAVFPENYTDNETVTVYRGVGNVTKTARNFLSHASTAQTVLAHTRAATVGKVCVENSHPFLIGDILGVHNGSIVIYKDLNTKYNRELEVDSQQIFAHLNDGIELDEIEGYGVFFFSK